MGGSQSHLRVSAGARGHHVRLGHMLRSKMMVLGFIAIMAIPTFALAQSVSTPLQLANGWSGKGEHEPSTSWDKTGTLMFQTPDQTATGHKVYFNAFMSQPICYAVCVGGADDPFLSPNLGSVGTGIPGYPYIAHAFLGEWRDCNKDGYVGLADNALFEYRQELLLDQSICPKTTVPFAPGQNYHFPHNDGTWVHEFIPIGWNAQPGTGDNNPLNINDSGARVWSDWGVPGAANGGQCFVSPEPRGTFHNVAGLSAWL